jgi:hypothetical protein
MGVVGGHVYCYRTRGEPASDDGDWAGIAPGELVVVDTASMTVSQRRMDAFHRRRVRFPPAKRPLQWHALVVGWGKGVRQSSKHGYAQATTTHRSPPCAPCSTVHTHQPSTAPLLAETWCKLGQEIHGSRLVVTFRFPLAPALLRWERRAPGTSIPYSASHINVPDTPFKPQPSPPPPCADGTAGRASAAAVGTELGAAMETRHAGQASFAGELSMTVERLPVPVPGTENGTREVRAPLCRPLARFWLASRLRFSPMRRRRRRWRQLYPGPGRVGMQLARHVCSVAACVCNPNLKYSELCVRLQQAEHAEQTRDNVMSLRRAVEQSQQQSSPVDGDGASVVETPLVPPLLAEARLAGDTAEGEGAGEEVKVMKEGVAVMMCDGRLLYTVSRVAVAGGVALVVDWCAPFLSSFTRSDLSNIYCSAGSVGSVGKARRSGFAESGRARRRQPSRCLEC